MAQLVVARTGTSQAEAEKRVDQVVAEAKTDAENTRGAAALGVSKGASADLGVRGANSSLTQAGQTGLWAVTVRSPGG